MARWAYPHIYICVGLTKTREANVHDAVFRLFHLNALRKFSSFGTHDTNSTVNNRAYALDSMIISAVTPERSTMFIIWLC